jgi:ABC-2 type transport system ATP-binding protein
LGDQASLELERDISLGPERAVSQCAGLSVRAVSKRFRRSQVLKAVDLEVAPGEVVALLGPNGAGKSTLLRILVGSITPDEGEVTIGGQSLGRDPLAARAAVSWVLGDEHGWYWRLTGLENLVFFAMVRGLPRPVARSRAAEQLHRYGLGAATDQRVGEYSTGMRARLALARATLVEAAVMVLDEPGRGLDVDANERLIDMLASVSRSAVLLVTHDLQTVSRVAARSILLDAGVVRDQIAGGTPAEILAARTAELASR